MTETAALQILFLAAMISQIAAEDEGKEQKEQQETQENQKQQVEEPTC